MFEELCSFAVMQLPVVSMVEQCSSLIIKRFLSQAMNNYELRSNCKTAQLLNEHSHKQLIPIKTNSITAKLQNCITESTPKSVKTFKNP